MDSEVSCICALLQGGPCGLGSRYPFGPYLFSRNPSLVSRVLLPTDDRSPGRVWECCATPLILEGRASVFYLGPYLFCTRPVYLHRKGVHPLLLVIWFLRLDDFFMSVSGVVGLRTILCSVRGSFSSVYFCVSILWVTRGRRLGWLRGCGGRVLISFTNFLAPKFLRWSFHIK